MSLVRAILCVVLPPVAVLDRGWGYFLVVLVLTCLGWIPGILAAMIVCALSERSGGGQW